MDQEFKSFEEEMEYLRKAYISDLASGTYNVLVVGPKGVGKTETIIRTCRKPAMVHSFDPGGTKHMKPEVESKEYGEIVIETFEDEDGERPTEFKRWEGRFMQMRRDNYFEKFGSYILDSGTTWLQACYNQIARKTKFASDGVLEIKGWAILANTLADYTKLFTSLPCDFYMTAHIQRAKDDISGRVMLGLAMPPSLTVRIPLLFDEYYIMLPDPGDESKRVFYTSTTDRIEAGTRYGKGGKFKAIEKPDFKYLMEKAGLDVNDKPSILKK